MTLIVGKTPKVFKGSMATRLVFKKHIYKQRNLQPAASDTDFFEMLMLQQKKDKGAEELDAGLSSGPAGTGGVDREATATPCGLSTFLAEGDNLLNLKLVLKYLDENQPTMPIRTQPAPCAAAREVRIIVQNAMLDSDLSLDDLRTRVVKCCAEKAPSIFRIPQPGGS